MNHDVKPGDEFAINGWTGPIRKVTSVRKNGNIVLDDDVRRQWRVWDGGATASPATSSGWNSPTAFRITPETQPKRDEALRIVEARNKIDAEIRRLRAVASSTNVVAILETAAGIGTPRDA